MDAEQMRRIIRQKEIAKQALVRALTTPPGQILFVEFKPVRNWSQIMREAREKIRAKRCEGWTDTPTLQVLNNPNGEIQTEEEDEDDGDEDYLADDRDFWRDFAAERSLQERLFGQIKGSVQTRNQNYQFINSLPSLSYGIFKGVVRSHARTLCPTKRKHDQWFEPMMKSRRGFTRLPFSIIMSTNGESLATLKGLRKKVPKKP